MNINMRKDLNEIAEFYGLKNQLDKLVEECNELAVEACHSKRIYDSSGIENIGSEIADVEIMCSQIKILLYIEEEVENEKRRKIERQLQRMKAYIARIEKLNTNEAEPF